MNFDKATGRQMALADIFVPGYEQRLNELLLEALQEKTGTKNLDELHEEGYLYSMNIFAPENFVLGDDKLTFIYNPYELADYSKGKIELAIDYDDLEDIMK